MQFTTILALFCAVAIAAPIMPTQADVELVARQSGSNSDGNPLAGLLNGGQQSDSDGEGNAVSTSECGTSPFSLVLFATVYAIPFLS